MLDETVLEVDGLPFPVDVLDVPLDQLGDFGLLEAGKERVFGLRERCAAGRFLVGISQGMQPGNGPNPAFGDEPLEIPDRRLIGLYGAENVIYRPHLRTPLRPVVRHRDLRTGVGRFASCRARSSWMLLAARSFASRLTRSLIGLAPTPDLLLVISFSFSTSSSANASLRA